MRVKAMLSMVSAVLVGGLVTCSVASASTVQVAFEAVITDIFDPFFFAPPTLEADTSGTEASLVDAVELATELLTERKEVYKRDGVQYYRPLVFLLTTGREPDWEIAADLVRTGEAEGAFAFQAIGVQGADMELLSLLTMRDPLELDGLRFRELFQWLGRSLQAVSNSHIESEFVLPVPEGWAVV